MPDLPLVVIFTFFSIATIVKRLKETLGSIANKIHVVFVEL